MEFFFLAFGQKLRLLGPFLAHDAAVELQMIVDPGSLFFGPGSQLVEVEESQSVQGLFIFGPDAADTLEIVGSALSRGSNALRTCRRSGRHGGLILCGERHACGLHGLGTGPPESFIPSGRCGARCQSRLAAKQLVQKATYDAAD